MQRLEVSGAVRLIYGSLGAKELSPQISLTIIINVPSTCCTDSINSIPKFVPNASESVFL
jgi:hypothetical protein